MNAPARSTALAAAWFTLASFAAPAVAEVVADVDIPFTRFVLPNGLTLLVHEDHKTPIVAVDVWYHVGAKDEPAGRTGFAHLFEHLMFNGTEHLDQDFFQAMERVGATDLNGTTNHDRTNYFANAPKGALDFLLWMESERMGYLLGAVDQAKLDEQRGGIRKTSGHLRLTSRLPIPRTESDNALSVNSPPLTPRLRPPLPPRPGSRPGTRSSRRGNRETRRAGRRGPRTCARTFSKS